MAASVKKAALFYGASLVGIAPFDERWIYSGYYDLWKGIAAPIAISQVKNVVLSFGQSPPKMPASWLSQNSRRWKQGSSKRRWSMLSNPPIILSGIPFSSRRHGQSVASQHYQGSTFLFTTLPTGVLCLFGEKLGMDFVIAMWTRMRLPSPAIERRTLAIPNTMKSVIVLAFQMVLDCMEASPTTLGDAASMDGYGKMAETSGSMARFLIALGFMPSRGKDPV